MLSKFCLLLFCFCFVYLVLSGFCLICFVLLCFVCFVLLCFVVLFAFCLLFLLLFFVCFLNSVYGIVHNYKKKTLMLMEKSSLCSGAAGSLSEYLSSPSTIYPTL